MSSCGNDVYVHITVVARNSKHGSYGNTSIHKHLSLSSRDGKAVYIGTLVGCRPRI